MDRRDLLRALGAASALAVLPHDAVAAWARVATRLRPANGLTDAQLALVGAIADTVLPRTDSPSATDVGVPAFVDVVVSENYSDDERAAFVGGLDALDAQVKASRGDLFALLTTDQRGATLDAIEQSENRRTEPARTYWRLKGLIIHGYFTSERVMKDVLRYEVMPGKFDGDAPMPLKDARAAGGRSHG